MRKSDLPTHYNLVELNRSMLETLQEIAGSLRQIAARLEQTNRQPPKPAKPAPSNVRLPTAESAGEMMNLREVGRFFGGDDKPLSAPTIYRWIKTGRIPKPVQLSKTMNRWRRSDCEAALKKLRTG